MIDHKKHLLIIIIASLLMGSSLGLNMNTIGVYLQPIADSLSVAMGEMSVHSTLISLGMAFAAFAIPPVLNRFSFRLVVFVATLFTAGATFLMSMATEVWMFNVLGLVRGVSSAFFGIVALQLLINNWFVSKHGIVTSIVFSISGLVGAIFSPILSSVILNQGWQFALVIQALLIVLFNLPGIFVSYAFRPEEEGLKSYQEKEETSESTRTARKVARKPYSFASITFACVILYSVFINSLPGLVQHLANIGIDFGFSAQVGAFMISASMLGNIVFKLVIGVISDKKGTITAVLSMMGLVGISLGLILFAQSNITILTGSFLYGSIYSITTVGLSLTVKLLYSTLEFPRVFPMVNFTANVGGAVAVSVYGFSYDLSDGYELAVIGSLVLLLLSAVLLLTATRTSRAEE